MNRLLEIGFDIAGLWLLDGDKLTFKLKRHSSQHNILYAFVCDGEVKYVGKTVQTLQKRMNGYKKPGPSQSTNLSNNAKIKALLEKGAAVDILALPDNGLMHYGQFHVNLAAGLEDSVISLIEPEWNGNTSKDPQGVEETDKTPPAIGLPQKTISGKTTLTQQQKPAISPALASFPLVVEKTYYNQGFFNVGVNNAALIGANGEKIEIVCANRENPIIGTINRTANTNGTPRIMAGKGLRDWLHDNLQQGDTAIVVVLSPTAIRIELPHA